MKNSEYWRQRFKLLEAAANKDARFTYQELEEQFIKAQKELEIQIQKWYSRFAANNQISMAEARRLLNAKELAEFRWDVREYIKHGEQLGLNPAWMKQLENASARFHISRLEALKIQAQQTLEALYGNQLDFVDKLMKKTYLDGYYHTAYEIQKGFNIGWDIAAINENQLSKIISRPWTTDDKAFSSRIWQNRGKLINEVHNQLSQNIILGKPPDESIKELATKLNTSKSNAGRLIMTESAYFSSLSQKDAFNSLDVERYEIIATLDSHTSEICQGLDDQIFDIKDYKAGVTAPPFHPWCRTTTAPYFDDNFGERAARGEDGKTYYVPSNMKYPEWKKAFVDGGSKDDLQKTSETLKVDAKTKTFKEKLNTIQGINDDYKQILIERFENGNETAKKVFLKYVPDNTIADGSSKNGAYYMPRDKKIYMNYAEDAENPRGKGVTFFHEHGHLIDFANTVNVRTDNYSKLDICLKEDYNNYIKDFMKTNKISSKIEVYNQISKQLWGINQDLLSSVSDLLGGLSKKKIRGAYGHDLSYWKNPLSVPMEAFAHLFEAQFDNIRLELLRKYFPKSIEVFVNILEELK